MAEVQRAPKSRSRPTKRERSALPKPSAAPLRERPAPALWRDPWGWACLAALIPLVIRCMGAPLGEPVAEDFDFLHRALIEGTGTLLDGGGSQAFWRPVAHQIYYALLGPVMVQHPGAVATIHILLLALGALLLYRALRPSCGGPIAAAAGSFPLLAESTRTLISWPSHFVDLGLFLFTALAIHEASRRRLYTALAGLLLALLCKEVAVVLGLMLPFVPGVAAGKGRVRWMLGSGLVLGAWGAVYLAVRHAAHLELPHGLEHDPTVLATPMIFRYVWSLMASLKAILSLTIVPDAHDSLAKNAMLVLLGAAGVMFALSAAARARFMRIRAWLLWGLTWFVLASATLTPIFPLWQPNRSQFGSVGLGVTLAAGLGAVHPAFTAGLVLTRLALLELAPGPATEIANEPPATGAFMDFGHLTRLQRFMRRTRRLLGSRYPRLPQGACVVQNNMPLGLQYALGGDKALQVWYRDSTLRWLHEAEFGASLEPRAVTLVQFEPHRSPEIVLIDAAAGRVQEQGSRAFLAGQYEQTITLVTRADSLAPDPHAVIFHAYNAGLRAFSLMRLDRGVEAEREGRRALALDPFESNACRVVANLLASQGRFDEAAILLETLLTEKPHDAGALELHARVMKARAAANAAPPPPPKRP